MNQYDPLGDLEQWMNVGTASCIEVSENFATFEDSGPMTANQFQSLLDGGWQLHTLPQVVDHPNNSVEKSWYYTFINHGVGV